MPTPDTFAHRLQGPCECGVEHEAATGAASHRTEEDQGAPSIDTYTHFEVGKPSQLWPYWYADGALACYVALWDLQNGRQRRWV